MKHLISTLTIMLLAVSAFAAPKKSMFNDLDSLGSNKAIAERAKAIDANNRIRVVQNRSVDRDLRFEFGVSYGTMAGGNAYVDSSAMGFMADFHITPMISLGVRHSEFNSELNAEGKRVYDAAKANSDVLTPAVDFPESSTMGVVTLYPMYGKLNFFNAGIAQFDLYVLGGYGQMKTQNGSSPTWTAGGGAGIWWSQHFSTRLEARYQDYQDKTMYGTGDQGATSVSLGIGFLL
ncbi:MAG: outer membrane beta-barrel domain-containing protein [Bdellovibrionota bacterium]